MLNKVLHIVFIILLGLNAVYAQEYGLPFVSHYVPDRYEYSTQSWDIHQDERGYMFFANNHGIVQYDGSEWKKLNQGRKRIWCLQQWIDGKIYASGINEFGCISPNKKGAWEYEDLSHTLPKGEGVANGDFRYMFAQKEGIYMSDGHNIWFYDGNATKIIDISWLEEKNFYLEKVRGQIYLYSSAKNSIYLLENKELTLLHEVGVELSDFTAYDDENLLCQSQEGGLYIFNEKTKSLSAQKASEEFVELSKNTEIRDLLAYGENFIVSTRGKGLIFLNKNFQIYNILNSKNGLQDDSILDVFIDREFNIWLNSDNGIMYLETSSPIEQFSSDFTGLSGLPFQVYRSRGQFYVGTNTNLYYAVQSELKTCFEAVQATVAGPAFDFLDFVTPNGDTILLCAKIGGVHEIIQEKNKAPKLKSLHEIPGAVVYQLYQWRDKLIIGVKDKAYYSSYSTGKGWGSVQPIEGTFSTIRNMAEDLEGNLWMGSYNGVFKWKKSGELAYYDTLKGIPDMKSCKTYDLALNKNGFVLSTGKGFYEYNKEKDAFQPFQIDSIDLSNVNIYFTKQAKDEVWFVGSSSRQEWTEVLRKK